MLHQKNKTFIALFLIALIFFNADFCIRSEFLHFISALQSCHIEIQSLSKSGLDGTPVS